MRAARRDRNPKKVKASMGSPDPAFVEETLALARGRLGADHPTTLVTMTNLGWIYYSVGRFDDAIAILESALPRMKSSLGERHANTLSCMNNLANSYSVTGKADKALPMLESLLELRKSIHGPDAREVLEAMNALASAYGAANRSARALELFEEAAKQMQDTLGSEDSLTIVTVNNLAGAVGRAGDSARAATLYEQVAESLEKIAFQHENAARMIQNTVNALLEVGKADKAEGWRRKWMAVVKERTGADSLLYGKELVALGDDFFAREMHEEGERAIREGLAILEVKAQGSWELPHAEALLGMTLFGQKKLAEAEPVLLRAYEGLKARQHAIPSNIRPLLPFTRKLLRRLYLDLGNQAEAERWKPEADG
jgi:non-specific serine/threonine protein kinase/serine/threonine-protein kinase